LGLHPSPAGLGAAGRRPGSCPGSRPGGPAGEVRPLPGARPPGPGQGRPWQPHQDANGRRSGLPAGSGRSWRGEAAGGFAGD